MSSKDKENSDKCAKLETRIPELPRIMRNQGWTVGARLMEKWLQMGANSNPKFGIHDTTTVRMDWVLNYGRALAVYQSAKNNRVWLSEKAKEAIIDKLIDRQGRLPSVVGEWAEIGNVGEGVMLHPGNALQFHDNWQIQLSRVTQDFVTGQLDDLYAALGNFAFYYLVKGAVMRLADADGKPTSYRVRIDKVGVYVRDDYDFNDNTRFSSMILSQVLGVWSCSKNYAGKVPGKDRYLVNNKDFREWRDKYGKGRGGDFMVFSNIKVFDTNDTFDFSRP